MTRRRIQRLSPLTLTVALTLGACGGGDSDGSPESAGPTSTSDPRDVSQWSPSFTPSSSPVTSIEESESRLKQVADVLRVHDLPEPTSEDELPGLVRTVSTYESGELWAQCLTDRGFEATSVGGAVEAEVVPEQRDMYTQVLADCVAMYPIDARFQQAWGEDQWKVMYEYLTGYYIPCVESYGIEIDRESIPGERPFIEAGLSGGDAWHPVFDWSTDPAYSHLTTSDTPEGADLADKCRQGPPDEVMYGNP